MDQEQATQRLLKVRRFLIVGILLATLTPVIISAITTLVSPVAAVAAVSLGTAGVQWSALLQTRAILRQ